MGSCFKTLLRIKIMSIFEELPNRKFVIAGKYHLQLLDADSSEEKFLKGGSGSGNFNHAGREGLVGGSASQSGATIKLQGSAYEQGANERAKARFGEDYEQKLASITGAMDGTFLDVRNFGANSLEVYVTSADYVAIRIVKEKSIENKELVVAEKGKGLGTKIFLQQVKSASENGFDKIETVGGIAQGQNGYYTWPRLGYDANIYASNFKEGAGRNKADKLLQKKGFITGNPKGKISTLMKTEEGRSFWKRHGFEVKMSFNLKEGSLSRRILDEYVKQKEISIKSYMKGGQGSGNFNHAGRKGKVGGSFNNSNIKLKVNYEDDAEKIARLRFGDDYERKLAEVAGAMVGSSIDVTVFKSKYLMIFIKHKDYTATRIILDKTIENEEIYVKKTNKGLGTKIFLQQVRVAFDNGFENIKAIASGNNGSDYNGYYTWPRLGYDALLSRSMFSGSKDVLNQADKLLNFSKNNKLRISDLMKTKDGRYFWKQYGSGMKMIFDLKPNSLSRRVLEKYAKEKGIK